MAFWIRPVNNFQPGLEYKFHNKFDDPKYGTIIPNVEESPFLSWS